MLFNKSSRLESPLVLGAACAVAFTLAMLATSLLVKSKRSGSYRTPTEGFDFTLNSGNEASAGPGAGARIDLTHLKMRDGATLASVAKKGLIMLVTVDPQCGACKVASDEMRDVHNRIEPLGVEYYPVSFTASVTASELSPDFFSYADSLRLNASGFLWSTHEEPVPEKLLMMVLPSHILIDADGVIVRKWSGTDSSPHVRRKMVNQIVTDTLEEVNRSDKQGLILVTNSRVARVMNVVDVY